MAQQERWGISLKVAIVHYWLVGMRGGERVLECLLDLYPEAVIITHVVDRSKISGKIAAKEIRETFISRLPGVKKHYQKYLPLMPYALELMDLQEFDLIISSESGPAKGIIPRPDATHVCYCHSPMRYIWDHYHIYRASAGLVTRLAMPIIAHKLRIWDVTSAARVDAFIANSNFIAQRINSYYRRQAEVIFPPVQVDEFEIADPSEIGEHYLLAGELVSYKRPDLAIEAFSASGRKLVVVGDGEMREKLEARAGDNVIFLGRVSFSELKRQFATCRALIFPGEEDFGMVPVEVMASGRPVVAYGRGGALDTVQDGLSGILFDRQTSESLNTAIDKLESDENLMRGGQQLSNYARKFDQSAFNSLVGETIKSAILKKKKKSR